MATRGDKYASFSVVGSNSDVVVCTLAARAPTSEDVDLLLTDLKNLMARGQRFRMIFDSTLATTIPMNLARRVSNWMSEHEPLIRDFWMGTGLVITSSVIRGLLNVIFAIRRPISPYKITADRQEAIDFVRTLS